MLFLRVGIPIVAGGIYMRSRSMLLCEQKRDFYADNTADITPGKPQEEGSELAKLLAERANKPDNALEKELKKARLALDEYRAQVKQWYVKTSEDYFRKERQFTDTLSSLHDKREPLWPNTLYILTGGFSGVILARKSNVFVRATVPFIFGLTAFKLFMPSTFDRTSAYLSGLEKAKLPDVYDKQQELYKKTGELVKQTGVFKSENEKKANEYYDKTRKRFADMTGLKVDEPITDKKN